MQVPPDPSSKQEDPISPKIHLSTTRDSLSELMYSLCFVKTNFTCSALQYTILPRMSEDLRTQILITTQTIILRRYKLTSQRSIPQLFLSFPQCIFPLITFPWHQQDILCFCMLSHRSHVMMIFSHTMILLLFIMFPGMSIVLIWHNIRLIFR